MTPTLRLVVGGAGLFAGLVALTAASAADLPPAVAKKAAAADMAALQEKLDAIAADPAKNKGAVRTARALALTLAAYGEDGKAAAGPVLAALKGKTPDAKKALEALKAGKGGAGGLDGYDLEDVMSPFRVAKSGGLNIEKDLQAARKGGKMDPAEAEVLGARCVALAEYTVKLPNDKAKTSPAMTKSWERLSKDMAAAGKAVAEEAGKGDKGDAKKLSAGLKKLDASCTNCHNQFRDE
ncbi:MAG: cytochrome c [Gemmataceae bacterium]|nr:cytochrome c [Gemmataceae bacterium]